MKWQLPVTFLVVVLVFISLVCIAANRSSENSESNSVADLDALARKYIDMLEKGEYGDAYLMFDETMKSVVPVHALEELWNSLIQQFGAYIGTAATRYERIQQYDAIFVTSRFERMVIEFQVVFNNKGQITGFFYRPGSLPDDAELPAGLVEKDVKIDSGDWTLPATLTVPAEGGPFPAVILIHGSGPNDRDETVGPNKPFRDLAWGLAKKGIAVLRYDKRTKVYGGSAFKNAVTVQEEVIDDVFAAITLLKEVPEVDVEKIFLLGHSLGGMLIPRIAEEASEKAIDIRGFIVMAGTARPFEDVLYEQYTYLFSLDGSISEEERMVLEEIKAQVERVKSTDLALDTPVSQLPLNTPASYWLDLRGYEPAKVATKIPKPFLILQGERDYQVTTADFGVWKETLSGRKDVEFKLYPGLNHLFIKGEGAPNPDEYQVPGHVDQKVIDDIAEWIGRY